MSAETSARRIALASPDIGLRERELVNEVLASGILALGPLAERFERSIAELVGRRHGISCSSGTAGLHMAVRALGIGPGDEVITTPFSFVASANCLLYEGAIPRFVDIEEETLGLDPGLVEAAAGPRTVGVLPVHVFGQPCRIEDVADIAMRRGWHLIEDACEALGGRTASRALGSYGEASVFAFYPNKQITTGEGGVVVTDDDALAEVMRSLRNQGRDLDSTWLRHVRLGYNYRMDELSAALGVAQLERLEALRAARARVAAAYRDALGDQELIRIPQATPGAEVDWFVYVVRLHGSIDRDAVTADLEAMGISTRAYFSPLHLQPVYQERFGYRRDDFPVTERVAAGTLALPWSTQLSDDDVVHVADSLIHVVERHSSRRHPTWSPPGR